MKVIRKVPRVRIHTAAILVGLLAWNAGLLVAQAVFGLPEQQRASVEGRITDDSRTPLIADVMIYGKSVVNGRTDVYAMCSTKSDAEGRYQCNALRPGRYVVSATVSPSPDQVKIKGPQTLYPRTFAPSVLSLEDAYVIPLTPGAMGVEDIVLHAVRPSSITGKLGTKPASPSFTVRSRLGALELPVKAQAQYDSQTGEFRIDDLPMGDLTIYADWWASGTMQHNAGKVHLGAGQQVKADLLPLTRHKVSGVLSLPKDAPASASFSGSLVIVGTGEHVGWHLEAPITKEGGFTFPEIVDGDYLLQMARDSGLYVGSIGSERTSLLHLAPGANAESLTVALENTATVVEGKLPSEEIVKGKTAVVFEDMTSKDVSTAFPDSDGTFKISGLRPGSYRVFAWADATQAEYRSAVELTRQEKYSKQVTLAHDSHVTGVELSLIPAGS